MIKVAIGRKFGQYRLAALSTIVYTVTAAAQGAYDSESVSMVTYSASPTVPAYTPPQTLSTLSLTHLEWTWTPIEDADAIVYWEPGRTEPTLYQRGERGFSRVGRYAGSELLYPPYKTLPHRPAPYVRRLPSRTVVEPTFYDGRAPGPKPYIRRLPEKPHTVVTVLDGHGRSSEHKVYDRP